MAKIDATPDIADAPVPVRISLNEYCTRLSETVKRPELIGAFHATEKAAGHLAGLPAEFEQRYNDFITKPA